VNDPRRGVRDEDRVAGRRQGLDACHLHGSLQGRVAMTAQARPTTNPAVQRQFVVLTTTQGTARSAPHGKTAATRTMAAAMPKRTPGVVPLDCLGDVFNVAAKLAADVHIDAGARHLDPASLIEEPLAGPTAAGGTDRPGTRLIGEESAAAVSAGVVAPTVSAMRPTKPRSRRPTVHDAAEKHVTSEKEEMCSRT